MKRRILSVAIIAAMSLSMVACGSSEVSYTEGRYEITEAGHNGDMKIAVTFTESEISAVEVIEHAETAGISDEAINTLPETIVTEQSAEVDSISGATITSEAIKSAVTNAISEATK